MKRLLPIALAVLLVVGGLVSTSAAQNVSSTDEEIAQRQEQQRQQQILEAWQQPGVIAAVNNSWACLIGSYHHTCTEWVNGAGQTLLCDVAGCNPLTTEPAPAVSQPPTPAPDEELECRDPSTIGVLVANGTDVGGAAGRLSGELNAANYVTLRPHNASPQTGSAFYYRAGYEVDAQCIARLLGESDKPLWPMPDPPPGGLTPESLGNAFILILIGPDSLAQSPG